MSGDPAEPQDIGDQQGAELRAQAAQAALLAAAVDTGRDLLKRMGFEGADEIPAEALQELAELVMLASVGDELAVKAEAEKEHPGGGVIGFLRSAADKVLANPRPVNAAMLVVVDSRSDPGRPHLSVVSFDLHPVNQVQVMELATGYCRQMAQRTKQGIILPDGVSRP